MDKAVDADCPRLTPQELTLYLHLHSLIMLPRTRAQPPSLHTANILANILAIIRDVELYASLYQAPPPFISDTQGVEDGPVVRVLALVHESHTQALAWLWNRLLVFSTFS